MTDDPVEQIAKQVKAYTQAELDAERGNSLASKIITLDGDSKIQVAIHIKKDILGLNEPKNAEELYRAFQVIRGIDIPTAACSEEFNAPFEWLYDFYFEVSPKSLAVAPRGGAKTSMAADATYMKCRWRPMYEAIHVASLRAQSDVTQGYLASYWDDSAMREYFKRAPSATKALWKSLASWKIVTGTRRGVSGPHPSQLTLDELEFWDMEAVEQSYGVPLEKNGYRRLWAGFSTRQKASGVMNLLCLKAEEADSGIKMFRWSCFETMKRCETCVAIDEHPHGTDDQRMQSCALWEDCHGKLGTKSTGWMTREFLISQKTGGMSKNAWETQYLCKKPSTHGLVLYNFEHEYATEECLNAGNYVDWEYQPDLPYFVWHDPSVTLKSVLQLVQIWAGRIFIFDEMVNPECPTISQAKKDLWELIHERRYRKMPKLIVYDPHRPDAGAAWEEGSATGEGADHRYVAEKPAMDEDGYAQIEIGVDLVRSLICNAVGERKLYVNPKTCPDTVKAYREHSYKTKPNGEMEEQAKPSNKLKDEVDTTRYGCIHAVQNGYLKKATVNTFFM